MAVAGWILDKSAAARSHHPRIGPELKALAGHLFMCPMSELEQLYSAQSARQYDEWADQMHLKVTRIPAPPDILERALRLQRDLAHHHGMWHRVPIPDLVIAETAAHHSLGVLHVDSDFDRIAEVNGITVRRLAT